MTRARVALALVMSLTASLAAAQDQASQTAVTLVPAAWPRWEASLHAAWLGAHQEDLPESWNQWYRAASGGAGAGYYWTPHLKLEVDASTSSTADIYTAEYLPVPDASVVFYRERHHAFRATTLSGGLNYQFFENAWFHPFLGAGIELLRERERVEAPRQIIPTRDPRAPVAIPALETEMRDEYAARPFVAAGFKTYVSERTFIRTDVRTSWSSDGVAALAWRGGVGVDF